MPETPLRLEPITLDLAAQASGHITAMRPNDPSDPEILRYRLREDPHGWTRERFLIQAGDDVVGFAAVGHAPRESDPERYGFFDLLLVGSASARAAEALELVERRALEHGSLVLVAYCAADQHAIIDELRRRGYARDREGRLWELDLAARREFLLAETERTRAAMRAQGIELRTLAASPAADRYERLLATLNSAFADAPHTGPSVPMSMGELRQRLAAPDVREDRYWTAWDGDELAAVSFLRFPPVRGNVWTGFTGSHRAHRGRGIARAVKMETLAQAIELGITRVRTGNDETNAPMLHINEELGYRLLPGEVSFLKRLPPAP